MFKLKCLSMSNIVFTVELVNGRPIVTKTVTFPDRRVETTSAPVLNVGECPLLPFSGYQTGISERDILRVLCTRGIYIFLINSLNSEPITSDKIVFLRNILKDVKKIFSPKKGRCNVDQIKPLVGIQKKDLSGFGLTVTRKKLHEKPPVTEEEKNLYITIYPDSHRSLKKKNAPRKYFLTASDIRICDVKEIAPQLMMVEK
jgi:hypothetical protein